MEGLGFRVPGFKYLKDGVDEDLLLGLGDSIFFLLKEAIHDHKGYDHHLKPIQKVPK